MWGKNSAEGGLLSRARKTRKRGQDKEILFSSSSTPLLLRRVLEVRDQVRAVLRLLEPGEDHLGA